MTGHDSAADSFSSAVRSIRVRAPVGSIAVDCYGESGIPVLLLHGIPGDKLTWQAVAEKLVAAGYSAIVPDLIGFGDSADSAVPLHAEQQAGQLQIMLDELGAKSVHVVGFDFGGPIAVHLSTRLGSRAISLTLANTNIFPDNPVPLPLRVASTPYLGDLAFRVFFSRAGLGLIWLAGVRERRALPFARFWLTLRPSTVRTTRLIFLESLRHLGPLYSPLERLLEASSTPALVIWSDRDPFFSATIGRRTAVAAGARLVMLQRCGHFTPQERPTEFAAAVLDHCKKSRRPFGE